MNHPGVNCSGLPIANAGRRKVSRMNRFGDVKIESLWLYTSHETGFVKRHECYRSMPGIADGLTPSRLKPYMQETI